MPIWAIVGFVLVAVGCGWIIYVMRRNDQFIQSIYNKLEQHVGRTKKLLPQRKNAERLKYIDNVIDVLLDNSNDMAIEKDKGIIYVKKHLFKMLIEGTHSGIREDLEEELKRCKTNFSFGKTICVLIEIDRYDRFADTYVHYDQYWFKRAVYLALQDVTEQYGVPLWSEWITPQRLAILLMVNEHTDEEDEKLYLLCDALRAWIEENLPFTVTIGVGKLGNDVSGITQSYISALESLNFKYR